MVKVQQFRQPMVTATGIFLGFMLDFMNGWFPNSFTIHKFRDIVIAGGALMSIALLIVVLYRVLRGDEADDSVGPFYKRTLRMFITGISIPFFSAVLIVVHKVFTSF
jgi:hypothetical protein